jgi:hypothetical protein
MLIFSISFPELKKFPYFMDTPERRVWGKRRPKGRVTLQIILVLTLTCLKTFTWGPVSVFHKYLHWPCVSVRI